ncbi:histidine kinase [Hoyosella sp. YIM 151337]|uniref:sensor histidine kinase n=1 Tax=Hoyosella sp. YIM 151337 TaxID=2992742 RepID=UPI002236BAB8|nr:histidine kinase [Hoyosella sp. YIM 151337]MCW4352613.1 histidine kinase [Hoyosella sp. YIM 151337]
MAAVSRMRASFRTRSALWIDVLLGVTTTILFVVSWATLQLTHDVPLGVQPVVAALTAGPVFFARRSPVVAFGAAALWAIIVPMRITPLPDWPIPWQVVHVIVLFVLAGAVAMQRRVWISIIAWAFTLAIFDQGPAASEGLTLGVTALVVVGVLLRSLVLSRVQLSDESRMREAERERRIILEERARIARDLHDVVAHQMSLVVVQAESAPYRLSEVSPDVRSEFSSIATTAREALMEVRGLLGVLREPASAAQRAPQPGVPDIEELLASTKRAGVPVSWTISGEPPAHVSALIGMSLYRIVQEALANATRHAQGAPVRVTITYRDDTVDAVIANKLTAPLHGVPGNGIAGMNERALSAGGEFRAGPTAKGSFEVRASLPVEMRPPLPAAPA